MTNHHKALLAALLSAFLINFLGILFFFAPIAKSDTTAAVLVPPAVGFIIYVVLTVALFDWAARHMKSATKAAFVIGASQFILVNVDFVLTGKRGIVTAGASAVVMLVTWAFIAFAYSRFQRFNNEQGNA
jgi:hypothetical protein